MIYIDITIFSPIYSQTGLIFVLEIESSQVFNNIEYQQILVGESKWKKSILVCGKFM